MATKQTGNNGCRGIAGPGRPKGSTNKVSRLLKEVILLAGENAGNEIGDNGLVSYLQEQAIQHPTAFMTLLGKVLPMQVAAEAEPAFSPPVEHSPRQIAHAVLQIVHRAQKEPEDAEAITARR